MDDKLEKALDISNYMITLNNQKRLLKEKYYENLVYYFNGARFTVTKELISFVKSLLELEQDTVVLSDDNDLPIEVKNIEDFYNSIMDVYFNASNNYFVEYNNLIKNRSVEGILDIWQMVFYYLQQIMKV